MGIRLNPDDWDFNESNYTPEPVYKPTWKERREIREGKKMVDEWLKKKNKDEELMKEYGRQSPEYLKSKYGG